MGPLLYEFPYCPAAYFYPKDLHKVVGFYDVNEHFQMDVAFILSAVQHIKTLYVDEVWGNFRFIDGGKTFEDMKEGYPRRPKKQDLLASLSKSAASDKDAGCA